MSPSFWEQQKINMTVRFLRWQYEKKKAPVPADDELRRQAGALLEEAGRIAARTGRNVMGIVKDLIRDLRKQDPPH